MRTRNRIAITLLVMSALLAFRPAASAQHMASVDKQPRAELAINYNYLRSNAPPGGCTCFSLNGGSATLALHLKPPSFALVADVGVSHAGSISSAGYSLTLSTFTAGVRYQPRFGHSPLQPFGQVLAGIAHSSGSLVEGSSSSVGNAGAAFAAIAGGGLDLHLNRHVGVRLIEADYLATSFDNNANNHQNNLRIGAGIVFHF